MLKANKQNAVLCVLFVFAVKSNLIKLAQKNRSFNLYVVIGVVVENSFTLESLTPLTVKT